MKKMEGEKPHRSSGGSSELFICFTSRPSSSMKISSKSILSLGRTEKFRDGSSSSSTLHTSLSRRLRHNGSMKGGQSSPMFPTTGKKKGCSFETPEPTSPKVTCIGQVRVKTKKQGKKMRARSKRRGEGSFRKSQEGLEKAGEEEKLGRRSQRWVSLPLSICEALRALGAEFNCFMPCGGRSSCWSSGVERGKGGEKRSTSCGAVFARWLMAVDEGEEEKRREIEEPIVLVVENRRENREEEIEVKEAEAKETKVEEEAEEDDDDESSTICIPPKNALLLMRCRSEPLRMASYMNRFWESPAPEEDEEEDVDDDDDDDDNDEREEEEEEPEEGAKKDVNNEENERVVSKEELEQMQEEETTIPSKSVASADATEESENTAEKQATVEVEVEVEVEESNEPREEQEGYEFSDEMVVDISSSVEKAPEEPQNSTDEEKEDNTQTQSPKSEVEVENDECRETHLQKVEEEAEKEEEEIHLQKADDLNEEETDTLMEQSEVKEEEDDESRVSSSYSAIIQSEEDPLKEEGKSTEDQTHETVKEEKSTTTTAEILVEEEEENEGETEKRNEEKRDKSLPECLLLMLCEPKLSMEVSKETWVCSTDFLRWRPEKQTSTVQTQICADDGDNDPTDSHLPHPPPAASNPAPTSDNHAQPPVSDPPAQQPSPAMGAVVEQKMASAATYEPFALTRCKSEPVRSSDKLAPEACFWKSRKLEQHPLGIGAAGIGF